jgi:IS5 family transposase
MMFKILLLQAWYNLSDPAMEAQLARDLLFKRFISLSINDKVPDHSTIWRFREQVSKKGLLPKLFKILNDQLSVRGIMIQVGALNIIDATVIEAHQSRPNSNKKGESTKDAEAGYNVKKNAKGNQCTTYGYKGHVNVDEDGFIKALAYSAGNQHDSKFMEELITGHKGKVYADSAYKSKKHDRLLGSRSCIHERAYRNKPLTHQQKQRNKARSWIRSGVERVFGQLKLHQGLGKARYLGLARNQVRFFLIAMSHNLKKGLSIYKECLLLQDQCA